MSLASHTLASKEINKNAIFFYNSVFLQKNRKILTFLEFQKKFSGQPIIPTIEVEKAFPNFDRNALTRWQRSGYIEKIRNGFYRLNVQQSTGDAELFFIANRIYTPSYVSLQSALGWHGFIPEGVFTVTSISTLKTQLFSTPLGKFQYWSIRPDLFCGYQLEDVGAFRFKIASPAKALLDLLYFRPGLSDATHFYELRFNYFEIRERFQPAEFENLMRIFDSKSLNIRAKSLLKFLKEHDAIV